MLRLARTVAAAGLVNLARGAAFVAVAAVIGATIALPKEPR